MNCEKGKHFLYSNGYQLGGKKIKFKAIEIIFFLSA